MNALEEKVLELIGESVENPDVFVDTDAGMAPIRDSINDAVAEILMVTGGYKRQYFLPLREGQAFYRLRPNNGAVGWITDAWSVIQQYRLEQTDLTRLCAYDPRWMIYTGNPEAYLPIGHDVVGFYPKPSGDSNVIELTICEIPSAYVTDRDRVKLRDSFKFATVHYAVSEYWASRGDAAEAQTHMKLYMDALGLGNDYTQQKEQVRGFQTRKDPWPVPTS